MRDKINNFLPIYFRYLMTGNEEYLDTYPRDLIFIVMVHVGSIQIVTPFDFTNCTEESFIKHFQR